MAHFAELDSNNIVLRVVVACNQDIAENGGEQSEQAAKHFESVCPLSIHGVKWVQTSYNKNFRKNFAGKGAKYDPIRDEFVNKQFYQSWTLDSNNDWQPPIQYPSITTYGDGFEYKYIEWDEDNQRWIAFDHSIPPNKFEWSTISSSWISII